MRLYLPLVEAKDRWPAQGPRHSTGIAASQIMKKTTEPLKNETE